MRLRKFGSVGGGCGLSLFVLCLQSLLGAVFGLLLGIREFIVRVRSRWDCFSSRALWFRPLHGRIVRLDSSRVEDKSWCWNLVGAGRQLWWF